MTNTNIQPAPPIHFTPEDLPAIRAFLYQAYEACREMDLPGSTQDAKDGIAILAKPAKPGPSLGVFDAWDLQERMHRLRETARSLDCEAAQDACRLCDMLDQRIEMALNRAET